MFSWTGIIDLWCKDHLCLLCVTLFAILPEIKMEIDFVTSSKLANICVRLFSIFIEISVSTKKMSLNYKSHIWYLFSSSGMEEMHTDFFGAQKNWTEHILSPRQCESITQSLNGNYPNGTHWHHSQLVKCWVNPLKPSVCTTDYQTFLSIDCAD